MLQIENQHHQLPSSIQILTVTPNQPRAQVRSRGPAHSLVISRRAQGNQRHHSGFRAMITLTPEYRIQARAL